MYITFRMLSAYKSNKYSILRWCLFIEAIYKFLKLKNVKYVHITLIIIFDPLHHYVSYNSKTKSIRNIIYHFSMYSIFQFVMCILFRKTHTDMFIVKYSDFFTFSVFKSSLFSFLDNVLMTLFYITN